VKMFNDHILPADGTSKRDEAVVLIHGLLRYGSCMRSLGKYLSGHGYEVFIYDYPTMRKKIAAHAVDFEKYLEKTASENPSLKINIVTHSLGGIITREALGGIDGKAKTGNSVLAGRIKRIVMLAPPNRGSDTAKLLIRLFPFLGKFIKPLPELCSSPDAYVMKTYMPSAYETGVIAARYDTEVSEKYTHLEGEKDHILITAEHSFIMYYGSAKKAVLDFLEKGKF